MAWHLAVPLDVLRKEINARWPGRDRASDGSIGDRAHSLSVSDHNPNKRGAVNAIDVDKDGIDVALVLAAIKRHPAARYIIYERRLYHRQRGWRPEPYDGPNPHDKHFHISIDQTAAAERDRRPWGIQQQGDNMPVHASEIKLSNGSTLDAAIITMLGRTDADVNEERFLARKERAAIVTAITSLGGRVEAKLIALEKDKASPVDAATRAALVAEFRKAADQAVAAIDVPTADEVAQATISKIAD